MYKFLKKYKAYLFIGYALLVFIHFVVKDAVFPISIIYYATPALILILFSILLLILFYKEKRKVFLLFISLILISVFWLKNNFIFNYGITHIPEGDKILFWNVAKNKSFPITIIEDKVENFAPKMIALIEANFMSQKELCSLEFQFPDYDFFWMENAFIGVKGEIENIYFVAGWNSHKIIKVVFTDNEQRKVSLALADIYANPLVKRASPIKSTFDFCTENKIDYLVGDLNTPYSSIHFKPYESIYQSMRHYGNGFSETWFYGIPLLEIDHIWIDTKLKPLNLEKFQYNASDHKMLLATVQKQ